MTFAFSTALFVTGIFIVSSCSNHSSSHHSREGGRQRRLDTFRASLPDDVRMEFDAISVSEDCENVGLLLEETRNEYPEVNAAVDSILQAELIDTFSNEEIVYYFWYYFDYAIETGSIKEP